MRAHFGLPSVEAEDKEGKPPISVKFEIPYFTTSGIQVRGPQRGRGDWVSASAGHTQWTRHDQRERAAAQPAAQPAAGTGGSAPRAQPHQGEACTPPAGSPQKEHGQLRVTERLGGLLSRRQLPGAQPGSGPPAPRAPTLTSASWGPCCPPHGLPASGRRVGARGEGHAYTQLWSRVPGALPEDHREEWLPGAALGPLHHPEWR